MADRKEYMRNYYQTHKQEHSDYFKKYYQEHKDELKRERVRKYQEKRADQEIMPWLIGFVEGLLEDGEEDKKGRVGFPVGRPYSRI